MDLTEPLIDPIAPEFTDGSFKTQVSGQSTKSQVRGSELKAAVHRRTVTDSEGVLRKLYVIKEPAKLFRRISQNLSSGFSEISKTVYVSAVANCTNTIIGAGTLAIPKTMGMTGVVSYHILVFAIFSVTYISLKWLVAVIELLPPEVPRNYEGVANHYLGLRWSAGITVAFFFGGLSLTMAYIILITTSLTPVLVNFGFGSTDVMQDIVRFGIGLGVCLPLTLLRDISRLRFTSTLAIFSMLFAVGYISFGAYRYVTANGLNSSVTLIKQSTEIFSATAMSISAYSPHIAVMPIYESLGPNRSPGAMISVVFVSLLLSLALYEAIGLAGYFQFGEDVAGNCLASVAETSTSLGVVVATVSVSLTLMFSVPIIVWPLRSCIMSSYQLLAGIADKEPTNFLWQVTTVLVMVTVLLLATLFPDVKTALSVVGSIGGAFIVFIYPSAFYLAVVKEVEPRQWTFKNHAPQLLMMITGVLMGILSLFFSIKSAFGL